MLCMCVCVCDCVCAFLCVCSCVVMTLTLIEQSLLGRRSSNESIHSLYPTVLVTQTSPISRKRPNDSALLNV